MDRGAWWATQSMGSQKIQTQLGTQAVMYPQRIPFGCYIFALCLHFCSIDSIMKSTIICQSPQVRDSALLGPASDKIRKEAVGNQLAQVTWPRENPWSQWIRGPTLGAGGKESLSGECLCWF